MCPIGLSEVCCSDQVTRVSNRTSDLVAEVAGAEARQTMFPIRPERPIISIYRSLTVVTMRPVFPIVTVFRCAQQKTPVKADRRSRLFVSAGWAHPSRLGTGRSIVIIVVERQYQNRRHCTADQQQSAGAYHLCPNAFSAAIITSFSAVLTADDFFIHDDRHAGI